MNKKNETKLLKDFPVLYAGRYKPMTETCMCWGFDVDDGWFDLIYKLSQNIVKLDPTCEAVQVKEKFGGLRFYVNATTSEVFDLINKAEKESYKICEVCGKSGKLRNELPWIQTLCEKHYNNIVDPEEILKRRREKK